MRTILPVLALALVGCGEDEGEVWLLFMPEIQNFSCTSSVNENFEEADPIEPPEEDPDWTVSETFETSDNLVYASIADGRKGRAYLTIAGQVIPGTRDGKTYTFEWTDRDNSSETWEFEPTTYKWTESYKDETHIVLTLERDKETKGLKGVMKVSTDNEESFTETDQWDWEEYPELPSTGQINAWSFFALEGSDPTNEYETPECDGDDCILTFAQACEGQTDIRAEWVGYSDAALPALQGGFGEL